jgi:hypothetical protein
LVLKEELEEDVIEEIEEEEISFYRKNEILDI